MAFDGMNMTNFQLKIGFNFEKYFKLNFFIGFIVSTTVCPPVAELAPRRFGPLFFGRKYSKILSF